GGFAPMGSFRAWPAQRWPDPQVSNAEWPRSQSSKPPNVTPAALCQRGRRSGSRQVRPTRAVRARRVTRAAAGLSCNTNPTIPKNDTFVRHGPGAGIGPAGLPRSTAQRPQPTAESSAAALALRDAAGHAQHVLAMELQILPLALREGADVHIGVSVDSHTLERDRVRHRRHDQLSRVLKGDEPLVEQVVHRRGQQQAVLAVEPLLVAAVPPGLYV